jgi:transcriptional regulator with XRE-family HTH domain
MKKYNRIKIVLAENDKTNKWLSIKLNKDKSTISRWCTNDMQPSIETLFEIATVLNVSPKDLICELNEKRHLTIDMT